MQVQQELERYERDAEYFEEHREELLQRYPERWVAIYNQRVVGAARDPKRLRRQVERQGIPPGDSFWEYVTDQEELLILATSGR